MNLVPSPEYPETLFDAAAKDFLTDVPTDIFFSPLTRSLYPDLGNLPQAFSHHVSVHFLTAPSCSPNSSSTSHCKLLPCTCATLSPTRPCSCGLIHSSFSHPLLLASPSHLQTSASAFLSNVLPTLPQRLLSWSTLFPLFLLPTSYRSFKIYSLPFTRWTFVHAVKCELQRVSWVSFPGSLQKDDTISCIPHLA